MTPSVAPSAHRIRAYFAPVDRASGTPTLFDAALSGQFSLQAPPAPWIDLGWIDKFVRKCGTKVEALRAGSPTATIAQARTQIEATVSLEFDSWGKLQSALASGSQQTNLLTGAPVPLLTGTGPASTASALNVGATAAAQFKPGALVAIDNDYTGQTGFVGAGIGAAYVASSASVNDDVNFVRRVTLNVGVVASISNGVLTLASPLPAGVPAAGMQVSTLAGFCDREGASFFQEWSALFLLEGTQGDRIFYHYPRLQPMQGSSESAEAMAAPIERIRLAAAFRALPITDASDGETVLCFRSYLPAPLREI